MAGTACFWLVSAGSCWYFYPRARPVLELGAFAKMESFWVNGAFIKMESVSINKAFSKREFLSINRAFSKMESLSVTRQDWM